MKKITKNVNGIYNNGNWAIRDNGEIVAKGTGINAYIKAKEQVKANTTKKYVEKFII